VEYFYQERKGIMEECKKERKKEYENGRKEEDEEWNGVRRKEVWGMRKEGTAQERRKQRNQYFKNVKKRKR
jgi:hypothetical protein